VTSNLLRLPIPIPDQLSFTGRAPRNKGSRSRPMPTSIREVLLKCVSECYRRQLHPTSAADLEGAPTLLTIFQFVFTEEELRRAEIQARRPLRHQRTDLTYGIPRPVSSLELIAASARGRRHHTVGIETVALAHARKRSCAADSSVTTDSRKETS
jgi:hypothetical protein